MSRPSIHISIPTPCHESWDSMDATEQGAFCHSCQKEVIDFSAMTDREVIEYLEKYKTGCGRFRKDQLDTKLTIPKLDNGIFRWRALFLGLISFISIKAFPSIWEDQSPIPRTEKKDTVTNSINKDSIKSIITDSIVEKHLQSINVDTERIIHRATSVGTPDTIILPTLIVEAKARRFDHTYITGYMTRVQEMPLEKENKNDTNGVGIDANIQKSHKHKVRDWFRHTFRIKPKH